MCVCVVLNKIAKAGELDKQRKIEQEKSRREGNKGLNVEKTRIKYVCTRPLDAYNFCGLTSVISPLFFFIYLPLYYI